MGDVASGASHDIGARNAIESFFEVDQALEMFRVALVTILAREIRLKFFQVDQRLEMLRVLLVTILAVEMRPETLFMSHQHANFLFSVFRVVQGEAKTPK